MRVSSERAGPRLRSLFDPGMPAALRCFAVLDGTTRGVILADDPARPTWAAVREAGFGTLYLGGALAAPVLRRLVRDLQAAGDVLVGLWYDDERIALLPSDPDYDGAVLDFTNRPIGQGLEACLRDGPAGCTVRRVDRDLFERSADREFYASLCDGAERFLERALAFYPMRDDDILSEAFAWPSAEALVEISTGTREPFRGRGYATTTCAHAIRACEALGRRPYWNCAKQNLASAAAARKLGYRSEKEYRLLAWSKESPTAGPSTQRTRSELRRDRCGVS